jgi:hypothetical protein
MKDNQIPEGSIQTFCKLSPETRAKLNLFPDDKAQLAQLEKVVKALPIVKCEAKAFTEGEDKITMSDAITLHFSVEYTNLASDETPGYTHSNSFGFLKRQAWWIIVADGATQSQVILAQQLEFKDKDGNDSNKAVFELKQRFGRAGNFSFHISFKCDAYVGFDQDIAMSFEVLKDDENRVIPEYSQEDFEAVNGPSYVETLMSGDTKDEDSDDPNEDQLETLKKKLEQAGLKDATERRDKKVSDENELIKTK